MKQAEKSLFTRLSTLVVRRTVMMARLVSLTPGASLSRYASHEDQYRCFSPSFASIKEETLIDNPLRCKGHYCEYKGLFLL